MPVVMPTRFLSAAGSPGSGGAAGEGGTPGSSNCKSIVVAQGVSQADARIFAISVAAEGSDVELAIDDIEFIED